MEALRLVNPDIGESTLRLAADQMRRYPWLMNSYFMRTQPETGYSFPEELTVQLRTNRYSGNQENGQIKLFITCSGASSPRPVTLRRVNGNWIPHEFSSLLVGIVPPEPD